MSSRKIYQYIIPFIFLLSCQSKNNNSNAIPGVFIPEHTLSDKKDTAFSIGKENYKVEIIGQYTDESPPSKLYRDKKGHPYYRYYRDMNFGITIYDNDKIKFAKSGIKKSDFAIDLPKNIIDSGVMMPLTFNYVPENGLFVFYSKVQIPGTNNSSGIGLVINQEFKPNYIVTK
jgi:hypothetical protein